MAAANDEFFVRFKYWFVVGGIIILSACGMTTNFNIWFLVNPILAAASFWPLFTPKIPALTFSAIKVAVYIDRAKANAINSGIILTPPLYVKTVGESCVKTGYSKVRLTPRKKNVNKGSNTKINRDIIVVGNCFPNCSLCFVA